MLRYLFTTCGKRLAAFTLQEVTGFARFANVVAAICCDLLGALLSMPGGQEIQRRLRAL